MKKAPTTPPPAVLELAAFFLRNGYVRRHNPARYAAVGCMKYKKGDEVRLVANDDVERARILLLLKTAGFKPGLPFRKGKRGGQYRVPIYGREQVARFLRIVEETGACQQPLARAMTTSACWPASLREDSGLDDPLPRPLGHRG